MELKKLDLLPVLLALVPILIATLERVGSAGS